MPVNFQPENLTGRHSVHCFQNYTKFAKNVNTFFIFIEAFSFQGSSYQLPVVKRNEKLDKHL